MISENNPTAAEDTEAIKRVLSGVINAWNRADGAAYGEFFTQDADYIDVTGTRTRGGEAIGGLHQFLFDGPLKGSRLEGWGAGQGAEIEFLSPDVALVISGGTSQLSGQTEPAGDRDSINTTVLVKHNGQWQVRA